MRRLLAAFGLTLLTLRCASQAPPPHITPRPAPRSVPGGVAYATWTTPPATFQGRICGDGLRDEEWYRVNLTEVSRLTLHVDLSGGASDVDLELYDSTAALPPFSAPLRRSLNLGTEESITADLYPGLYYVRVYCFTPRGPTDFTLNLYATAKAKPPAPKPQPADEAKSHATVIQRMGRASIGYDHFYRSRWYRVDVSHAGTLDVTVQAKTTNGALLFDVIGSDDLERSWRDPTHIKLDVRPGPIYFHLQTTSPLTVAQYEFHVEVLTKPAPVPRAAPSQRATAVRPPSPAPPPPEPPRSSAIPLQRAKRSQQASSWSSSAIVAVGGGSEPPARWFTFTINKKSAATISFSGTGRFEIYPRGANQPVNGRGAAHHTQTTVELQRGEYDVRVIAAASRTEGVLSISVHESDDTSGFVKKNH